MPAPNSPRLCLGGTRILRLASRPSQGSGAGPAWPAGARRGLLGAAPCLARRHHLIPWGPELRQTSVIRGDFGPGRKGSAWPMWSWSAPSGATRARERSSIGSPSRPRSEEHTSELQSHSDLVCRLLLEKKKKKEQV